MVDRFADIDDHAVRRTVRRGRMVLILLAILFLISSINMPIVIPLMALLFFVLTYAGYNWARIGTAIVVLFAGIFVIVALTVWSANSLGNRIFLNIYSVLCLVSSAALFWYPPIRAFQEYKLRRREGGQLR